MCWQRERKIVLCFRKEETAVSHLATLLEDVSMVSLFERLNRTALCRPLFICIVLIGKNMEVEAISKNYIVNEDIKKKEVRLLSKDGEQLGIFSSKEALKLADEAELDLVMISPNANPPVCKIMDLGKFIYEQSKKEKEAKKKQKVINVKEIRVSLTIEENDIAIKAKKARKFLLDGDKVKVTVRFRGREMELGHIAQKILDNFQGKLEDVSIIEKQPKREGRSMTMILGPKKA